MKDKNTRNLKVYKCGGAFASIPQIKFQGNWLEQAGFNPGDGICIVCEDGKLTISRTLNKSGLGCA